MTILEKIVDTKRDEIRAIKKKYSLSSFEGMEVFGLERRDFKSAISKKGEVSIIAEIKKASPSKGIIRPDFNHLHILEAYQKGGAAAVSVLTDVHYFQGSLDFLAQCSAESDIPLLRKDFLIDPIQVFEAKAHGADAILLIATILSATQLDDLWSCAQEIGLKCLVEIYEESELQRINVDKVDIIGVNNRNLNTFEVDLHRGVDLLAALPEHIIRVSESGLDSANDLEILHKNDIHAALIGERFMKEKHPGDALKRLLEEYQEKVCI